MSDYAVTDPNDVSITDLSNNADVIPDLDVRRIGEALGLENARMTMWYFEPGDGIGYHAHSEQEEFFYIIAGEFSVKIGRSGATEVIEVGPGAFYRAAPGIGHGHRYMGDSQGVVLAIGAPPIDDPGLDPHQLD